MSDTEGVEPDPGFDVQLEWSGDEYQRPFTDAASGVKRDGGESVATSPTPLLPALASRVDNVLAAVAALTARVDGLAAASHAFQSGISDRLVDYIESTSAVTSAQTEALDEYRRSTERSVTELRRATAATDKLLRKLIGRLDEVSTDVRLATEASDGGGPAIDRDELMAVVTDALAPVTEAIDGLYEQPSAAADATSQSSHQELAGELAEIRKELTQLKRRVGLRGKTSTGEHPPQGPGLSPDDLDRLTDAIVDRLAATLEVVPDDSFEAPVEPEPPTPRAPRRSRSARS